MEKHLDFVSKHFKEGIFNPTEALLTFRKTHRITIWKSYVWTAAAVAAAIVAGVFSFKGWQNSWTEYTASAELTEVVLPDGSIARMAPGATVKIQRHLNPRAVHSQGRVWLEVRKDSLAPFTVDMDGRAAITVLGTKFLVDAGDEARVDLFEGRVLFCGAGEESGIILTAGQSAHIEEGAPVYDDAFSADTELWRSGRFHFNGTALEEVLARLESFYGVSLSCTDATGKALSGRFKAGRLDDLIAAIEEALDVRIEKGE